VIRPPRIRRAAPVALVVLTEEHADLRAEVVALSPRLDQERYSGRARETLAWADSRPAMTPFAITLATKAVGFGILDRSELDLVALTPHPELAVLLRSFYIGAEHQGRGYGRTAAAATPALARTVAPRATQLLLTVNEDNPVARAAYLAAGFTDTGERFVGGALGPQHVLRHSLRPRL
jgi:RimJ/RimL family protein N-acetyltransferase